MLFKLGFIVVKNERVNYHENVQLSQEIAIAWNVLPR